uniref:cyclin-dependent protein kinase inhibitor SMR2-like n=1 Tax=Erigeron canadensis TaxID=72917 RepID=UPI001CB8BCA0|nr:cyclin-dependent protein kinase inhibitor SMR2-like [Erigeron canadensis]
MSTDLQLPEIEMKLTPIKIKLSESPPIIDDSNSTTSDQESCTVQSELEEEEELESCTTPMSSENKIPEIFTCPPAPRKIRHFIPNCKLKISEFEFFEIVASDEIDSFFNTSFEFINLNSNNTNKKRKLYNL